MMSKTNNKFFPAAYLFVLAGMMLLSYLLRLRRNEFSAELAMESDAMAIVNYYLPRRIELRPVAAEKSLKLPPFKSAHPLFGALALGNSADSLISLVLDESPGQDFSYLYIDKNNDEDLTNDDEPGWSEEKGSYWSKEVLIDVYYKNPRNEAAVPYPVRLYRFKHRLHNSVMAYRNGYRRGKIALVDTTYKIALFEDDMDGLFDQMDKGALIIDVNGDGVLDGSTDSAEYYPLNQAFNIHGISYRVKHVTPSGDRITIARVDTMVFPKVTVTPGKRPPAFRSPTLAGEIVDLKEDYAGKIVLLDFWASWCKPWEQELPSLKNTYYRFHPLGFEIVGINLDYDLDKLKKYLVDHKINWAQIANGLAWDMPLVQLYGVDALPRNFLLDRNGILRYKNLHGKYLGIKVRELLNETNLSDFP